MTRALGSEAGVAETVMSGLIAAVDRLTEGGRIEAVMDACRAAIATAKGCVEAANLAS
jgi:hypothetical protein